MIKRIEMYQRVGVRARVRIALMVLFVLISVGEVSARQDDGKKESVSFSIPKTLYFTGEKIWIDAQVWLDGNPTNSQVLYAELIDRSSAMIAYVKMPLINGEAFNYFFLPPNVPSDHYLLRVYTRISPYLDQERGIAQQFVTVINPAIPPAGASTVGSTSVPTPQTVGSFSKNQKIDLSAAGALDPKSQRGISIANPFLSSEHESIASSQAYGGLQERLLIPELFGHVVEVKVPNPKTDATYFVSVHGKQSALFTDIPNADGRLLVDIGGLKHWDRVIIQLENGEEMPGIEVVQPLVKTVFKPGFDFPTLTLRESDLPKLEKLLKASQVEAYYREEYLPDSMEAVLGFVADHSYNLDDYTRFDDVETVLKEYVPSVMVRTNSRKKEFRLVDEVQKGLFDSNPLVLVDAMPVFDSDMLASFNPKFMQRLEVLNREFYLNQRAYPGVLSWSSYQNNFGLFPLASNARFFDYFGLQPKIEMDRSQFSKSSPEARFPDWRTVLFWGGEGQGLGDVEAPDLDGLFLYWTKSFDASGKAQVSRSYFSVSP